MARLRYALASALALSVLLGPRVTRAQSCHLLPSHDPQQQGFRATLTQETASFRSERYEGHFQGLTLSGSMGRDRLFAGAALPVYRIVRNGLAGRGFGDLLLHSQALLLTTDDRRAYGGLVVSATLPTGDERNDLGMGHAMLMPGAWASASVDGLRGNAQISYGRALTGSDAHHHGGPGPIVAPMNMSELAAALSASMPLYAGWPDLRLSAGADGAVPVLDDTGDARINAHAALRLGDRAKSTIALHVPITGEPSIVRFVIELSVSLP